jgi:hypothetical protein
MIRFAGVSLDHRLVGGVGSVRAAEPAQDGLCARGACADRRRLFDLVVVLLGDDVPPDRAGQRWWRAAYPSGSRASRQPIATSPQ